MGMSGSELGVPLVGAFQASISVLLTIVFGVLAAQFNLLSTKAAKELSNLCVRMFMPALLIYQVGKELEVGTLPRYVPIIIWSIAYNLLSMGVGSLASRALSLPTWASPALAFNNTTSLPLLLVKSLESTGILNSILRDGDTASEAVARAQSYFLINAMISNSMTFALGPRLLKPGDEDSPSDDETEDDEEQQNGDGEDEDEVDRTEHVVDDETSLLPQRFVRKVNRGGRWAYKRGHHHWKKLPQWSHEPLDILYSFMNAPLIGAIVGAIIGLTPFLHKLFFNDSTDGGYLNAWLTAAIKNIGDLFASTQIIVVGVKLSQSLRKMKRGEDSGPVSKTSVAFITLVRFIIWPAISIPLIWAVATKTDLLNSDPILWFTMMLMPTGPPAMILVALSDVNGSPEMEKMAIAKFLTISYAITPLICFSVVGSLKASEAALKGSG